MFDICPSPEAQLHELTPTVVASVISIVSPTHPAEGAFIPAVKSETITVCVAVSAQPVIELVVINCISYDPLGL